MPCRSSSTRVWRVSSQATTSASRSARQHAQRDVLHVADRRGADDERAGHRASTRSIASSAAPTIPDASPKRVGTIRTWSRDGASARSATTSRAGSQQQLARGDHPAAHDDDLRVEDVDDVAQPDAEVAANPRHDVERHRIAVVGELGRQHPGDLAPGPQRLPEARVRQLLGRAPCPAPQRRPGHEHLQAAAVAAGAHAARRRRRPCGPTRPRRRARRAAARRRRRSRRRCPSRASAAPPSARRAPRRAGARRTSRRWRRCRRRPARRAARPSRRAAARRAAAGGRSWRRCPSARRPATGRRSRPPSARARRPCAPPRTASTKASSSCSVPLPSRAWRNTRWWTLRSGSTTPASSFVPPRSTPITHPADMRVTLSAGCRPPPTPHPSTRSTDRAPASCAAGPSPASR